MKKLLCTTLAVGIMSSMSFTPAFAYIEDVNTLPGFNSGTNVDVTTAGNKMNVQINAGQGGIGTANWNSFNVGKDATVNFEFTDHNQTALNKVSATGGLSQIYGNITSSGCANCGYDTVATSKVILINPNGVLFGEGANVNLNSFTVSTLDGTLGEVAYPNGDKKQAIFFSKYPTTEGVEDNGIKVYSGATIHADKGVTMASNNIDLYHGSIISTNVEPNNIVATEGGVADTSYGKVKLVTADGVNFVYYNNGAVKDVVGVTPSSDVMQITINGQITSGNIDIRNYSNGVAYDANGKIVESQIELKGAVLKAVKAEKGNDGNIWLISNRKIILDGVENDDGSVQQKTILETVNYSDAAADRVYKVDGNDVFKYGEVYMKANGNISVDSSEINAVGDVEMTTLVDPTSNLPAVKRNITIENSTINTPANVNISANNIAAIENGSIINANDLILFGMERAQVANGSIINAENTVNIGAQDLVWLSDSLIKAKNGVIVFADRQPVDENGLPLDDAQPINGNIWLNSVKIDAPIISLNAAFDVLGVADVSNQKTDIRAGKDINVALLNVGNRDNGLIAEAGNNLTVQTDGTLAVARLVAKNGNLTLKADKVIKGLPYTEEEKLADDLVSDRGYIEVRNGTFTSITANDSYEVTASGEPVDNGANNMRHHIQYGEGAEKILLVTKMPAPAAPVNPDVPNINVNDDQASMLNRLPQQPQTISPNNNITDGRTSFIDVFAAASQIEIDEEEE